MSALTDLGFERPTYDEILDDQITRAKELFGETIDTSDLSVLGKYIRLNVSDIDTLYQTLEGVYYARFPNTATGASIDRLCPFAGISRNPATYAKHEILITGTAEATIEAGFEVSNTNQSVIFLTDDDYTIGEDGTVTAYVICDEAGTSGNVSVGTIDTIVNPSADVESIEHTAIVTYGEEEESDTELRKRFNEAIIGTGTNSAQSIKSAVLRVTGVSGCEVIENSTDEEDGNGIPAHSFAVYVLYDGEETTAQAIGEAIFEKKPIGIASNGSIDVTVTDVGGNTHTVYFSPATEVPISINIEILTNDYFESDGVETIKNNLTEYINGLSIGETVYISALYSYINITGVVNVMSLELSNNGGNSWSTGDIVIDEYEVARTTVDYITVTESE